MKIKIVDYSKRMKREVRELFLKIYPGDLKIAKLMAFDEGRKDHVATKIAVVNGKFAGQANMFRFRNKRAVSNLGYHVLPRFRQKGIGSSLCSAVMKAAQTKGIKKVLIRTYPTNTASISLAKSLGFKQVKDEFKKRNIIAFKKEI